MLGVLINMVLALLKVLVGFVGNSYAMIADGIESSADVVSSFVVWGGLRFSLRPADHDHPYGHGKSESLAGLVVAVAQLGAAIPIAVQSVHEIRTPHPACLVHAAGSVAGDRHQGAAVALRAADGRQPGERGPEGGRLAPSQ